MSPPGRFIQRMIPGLVHGMQSLLDSSTMRGDAMPSMTRLRMIETMVNFMLKVERPMSLAFETAEGEMDVLGAIADMRSLIRMQISECLSDGC